MLDGTECPASPETVCFTSPSKRKKMKNKKRFSDDQIKSLETMFETETKLEPRRKLQLARDLGLQPRQVAIWFQNKRARWKSKQLERDYGILLENYNNLATQFDALKKEKQSLVVQLRKLHEMMEKSGDKSQSCRQDLGSNGNTGKLEDTESELVVKSRLSFEGSEHGVGMISDDDSSIKAEYFGLDRDEPELVNMVELEAADGCLSSPEDWDNLESGGLLDQSSTSDYQWWDFWS